MSNKIFIPWHYITEFSMNFATVDYGYILELEGLYNKKYDKVRDDYIDQKLREEFNYKQEDENFIYDMKYNLFMTRGIKFTAEEHGIIIKCLEPKNFYIEFEFDRTFRKFEDWEDFVLWFNECFPDIQTVFNNLLGNIKL